MQTKRKRKRRISMATSSFNKDFTLNTKKAVESFEKILSKHSNRIKINKELVSPENEMRGEKKLRQMLSR
jgi:hypothetical protein